MVNINDNQIDAEKARDGGIVIFGGVGDEKEAAGVSGNNMVAASIFDNGIDNSASCGICVAGGLGLSPTIQTTQNSVTVDIKDNTVTSSKYAAILAAGGWSASESTAEAIIANNTVTNAGGNGIEVNGGTAQDRGDNRQGASSNMAMGTIQGNTVQASTFSDIAVFGGIDDSAGAVTGNLAEQRIGSNNARSAVCQDGLPGNVARCSSANASMEAATATQREEKAITVQPGVVPLLNQLDERMTDLRTRAQAATSESRAELLRLAERLAERKAQIMQRRQEVR